MDREERANYESRVLDSLVNAFGRLVVPVQLPMGSEKSLKGVIDLVTMKPGRLSWWKIEKRRRAVGF